MDALADVRNDRTQEIAGQNKSRTPAAPPHHIERQITHIAHLRSSRDGRAESTHDGHETRQNHRFAAIMLVKVVRSLQMATLEKGRILATIKRLPRMPPNPIAQLIAG